MIQRSRATVLMNRLTRIRPIALVIGWVIDVVGTSVFQLPYLMLLVMAGRLDADALADPTTLNAAILAQLDIAGALMLSGVGFSVLGGYVAARVAGREEILHGALSSLACLALEVVSLDQLASLPLWFVVLGTAAAPGAGILGGWLRLVTKARRGPVPGRA